MEYQAKNNYEMRYLITLILLIGCAWNTIAQEEQVKKTKKAPIEFGLHFGNLIIDGDVAHRAFPGLAGGIHFRKAVNHSFSLRLELMYGQTEGLDSKPSSDNLIDDRGIFDGYTSEHPWFFSYQTTLARANIQGMLELTNLGRSRILKNYNIFLFGGLGFNSHGTKLNLRDENNEVYTDLLQRTNFNTTNEYDTNEGRRAIRDELKSIYDDTYETNGPKKKGLFRLGDETNITAEASIGFGISRRISKRFNISLEHQTIVSDNDLLDGQNWRTRFDQTNNLDVVHYSSIRLAINLGKKPLPEAAYWENPWDKNDLLLDSLQTAIESLQHNLSDEDGDGVLNIVDEESESQSDCPVDTKGRTLDSDRDGVIDCEDDQPYMNNALFDKLMQDQLEQNDFLAQLDSAFQLLQQQVNKNSESTRTINNTSNSILTLSPIFFDTNSDKLSESEIKQLAHIANQLKKNNIRCITIIGHADERASDSYNLQLSERRSQAVKRILADRFNLSITMNALARGETSPLVNNPMNDLEFGLNRRVEILVCD